MKVGDLVRLNSNGKKVVWTESFRDAIGLVKRARTLYGGRLEFQILWSGIARAENCSATYNRSYSRRHKQLPNRWICRNYLKHEKKEK